MKRKIYLLGLILLTGGVLHVQNAGVGTTLFASKLSIVRNLNISSDYPEVAALANEAIIEGDIGLGTPPPGSSTQLYISSTAGDLFFSRMTTAQQDAIVSPAKSLLIFNTATNCFEWLRGGAWIPFGCARCTSPSSISPTNAITNVTATSLDANWTAKVGAINSYQDVVAAPGFTTFVPSYKQPQCRQCSYLYYSRFNFRSNLLLPRKNKQQLWHQRK